MGLGSNASWGKEEFGFMLMEVREQWRIQMRMAFMPAAPGAIPTRGTLEVTGLGRQS